MIPQKDISARAWAELVLLAVIWGASFLAVRIALTEVPVVTSVLHRTFWAMLVLWAVVAAWRLPLPRDPWMWAAFLVMGCLNNVIPFALMAWAQLHVEIGLISILNGATAIFGVIVAALVFSDERLTLRKAVGVTIGFLGVATAIGLDALRDFDLRSVAQIAVISGTVFYAVAGAWARITLRGLAPEVAAAGMLTGSTVILLPAALLIDGVPRFDLAPATWAAMGYYSLIATAGAYLLFYRVLASAGSGNAMLVTLLIPPIAILIGAVVLGEKLHPSAFVGLGLLAVGLLILDGRALARLIDRARRPR